MSSTSSTRRARAVEVRRAALDALVLGGHLRYPDELPITARRDELLETIERDQVVIVAGETGSGKSTQLPKLCLELGRGVAGLVGHTQPRRVAARAIAERVASELGRPLGDEVGYSVRFTDRVGDRTLVRLMTDGIVLAELPRDRQLRRYDTIIVDEAHERSLNIDVLLGHLRQLLPVRPDLKVIVTSATIDTERFARHFAVAGTDATVIEIGGRTFPVEVRYRPIGEDAADDRDQVQAVLDAVDELAREGPGDVLVFLSGEREIHDTADALRRSGPPDLDVLPLYARLSSVEQQRIFEPHRGRRVILSTNVAETSLTVPGIRYVVDAGTARVSRYSRRLKVQQLPIEPVSQASANQRAGRCGRIGPGICIRLFAEEDFAARPAFTEPEVLRTNLASVILQMTAIGLGDLAAFPFVEPPDRAAIRDGERLLEELHAIEVGDSGPDRRLTAIGRRLARLPIDPRLGRMVLEGDRLACLREVLVIAAALSIPDPRERPADSLAEATALHRRFEVPGSDLLAYVSLWDHLRREQRQRSSNQFRKLCRSEHLSWLRVREWQDLFSQLRQAAGELGLRVGADPDRDAGAHPDHVHRALLTGLLSHIGMRDGDRREYRTARGGRFTIVRGSVLASSRPRWVMAGELVETDRVWARQVAAIDPAWAEQAGAHLVRRSYGEPRWDARRGAAVTSETVTLYGLPIVAGRTVGYDRVDRVGARDLFVRHALVARDWPGRPGVVDRNHDVAERVQELGARLRRADVVDDEMLAAWYDARIPADVVSSRHFDRWWRDVEPAALELSERDLLAGIDVDPDDLPDTWRQGDLVLDVTYRFEPGHPLDGATLHVPLAVLNRLDDRGLDWLVPGWRDELVVALTRTLPKELRRQLIPLADTVAAATARLGPPAGRLVDALADALTEVSGVPVPAQAFDPERLPAHLRLHLVVHDADGAIVDAGSDLGALRSRLLGATRAAVAASMPLAERRGIVAWDVGTIPPVVEAEVDGLRTQGFPALVDDGDSVSLRVLTDRDQQQRAMRRGVRRLVLLAAAPSPGALQRSLDAGSRLAVARAGWALDDLAQEAIIAAADQLLDELAELPFDDEAFAALRTRARHTLADQAAQALRAAAAVLGAAARVAVALERLVAPALLPSAADARDHLARLVHPGFVVEAGPDRLGDVERYVRGIEHRLERLGGDVARDRRRMAEVRPLEQRWAGAISALGRAPVPPELDDVRWRLEELRVSLFAQPLGAKGPVSATRIARALAAAGA